MQGGGGGYKKKKKVTLDGLDSMCWDRILSASRGIYRN
jgi:hypothetical protein